MRYSKSFRLTRVAFSPDSQTLASLLHETVKLWNVKTGGQEGTLSHTAPLWSLAFSPDGTTLATSGQDGAVWLWNLSLHENVATLEGHSGPVATVAFSPDGTILASAGGDATIRLWHAATKKEVQAAEWSSSLKLP